MRFFALSCFVFLGSIFSYAVEECMPAKPSPAQFVNNLSTEFPNFISKSDQSILEEKLQLFNKETSNQIVIVIVDDLCGYDANEFSTRLGQAWGVGQGKFDNGVVVMIKPTGGEGQRDAYIAVGYGLEGIIPDVTANRILDNEIIPRFQNGDFYAALDAATTVIISLAKNEFSYKDYQSTNSKNWSPFIIFIIAMIIIGIVASRKRSYTMSRTGRSFRSGGWGGFGGGSFGGGGGFGGGGSFGGGGFGGGGAGGKW